MNITYKQIIPAFGLSVCVISAIFSIALKWLILMIVIECCVALITDPYRIFERWLPPVSVALIVSAAVLITADFYWLCHYNFWTVAIPALVASLMIAGVIRFNRLWLSDYRFKASQALRLALVSTGEPEHLQAWDSFGQRETETMLRAYMHKAVSIAELEQLYRQVYSLGYIHGADSREDEMSDLAHDLERLQRDYDKLDDSSVSLDEYNKLFDEYDSLINECNDIRQMMHEDSALAGFWRSRYTEINKKYELLLAEIEDDAAVYEDMAAADEEPPAPQEGSIIELPSIEDRIIRDRENGASYGELAERYNTTKSHIQYVLRKRATA